MIEHGTKLELENHPRATLNNKQVKEIIEMYNQNMGEKYVKRGTRQMIAKKYNITVSAVKDIIHGRAWSAVTGIKNK
jgi:hypothetical protein